MVGFGEAIKAGFAGSTTWSGRSTRAEFWWWMLFVWLLTLIPYIGVFASMDWTSDGEGSVQGSGGGASALWLIVALIVVLALLLPTIAVSVRRLHDTSHSGWWYWITLVPCIGVFWYLFLVVSPSTEGQNQYG